METLWKKHGETIEIMRIYRKIIENIYRGNSWNMDGKMDGKMMERPKSEFVQA